jgi:hypothetical protein
VIFFGEVFHHAASHDAEANESDLRCHEGSIHCSLDKNKAG